MTTGKKQVQVNRTGSELPSRRIGVTPSWHRLRLPVGIVRPVRAGAEKS